MLLLNSDSSLPPHAKCERADNLLEKDYEAVMGDDRTTGNKTFDWAPFKPIPNVREFKIKD
jgi:hypothetical protein